MSRVCDADIVQLQQIRRECDAAIHDIRSIEENMKKKQYSQNL